MSRFRSSWHLRSHVSNFGIDRTLADFVPLAAGGRIVLVRDALALAELPPDADVRLLDTVPSAISELLRQGAAVLEGPVAKVAQ